MGLAKVISVVNPMVQSFLIEVRKLLAFLREEGHKVFAMKTQENFPAQRMCPFCGLITARSKAFCLECGKSLGEVHP